MVTKSSKISQLLLSIISFWIRDFSQRYFHKVVLREVFELKSVVNLADCLWGDCSWKAIFDSLYWSFFSLSEGWRIFFCQSLFSLKTWNVDTFGVCLWWKSIKLREELLLLSPKLWRMLGLIFSLFESIAVVFLLFLEFNEIITVYVSNNIKKYFRNHSNFISECSGLNSIAISSPSFVKIDLILIEFNLDSLFLGFWRQGWGSSPKLL